MVTTAEIPKMVEDSELSTMKEYVWESLTEKFISSIPIDSIKDLPQGYMYSFGAISIAVSMGMFLYFAVTSYQSAVNSPFVSLPNLNTSGAICHSVSKPVTGTFLASYQGLWNGAPGFKYSQALYSFQITDFVVDPSQWQQSFNALESTLIIQGEKATNLSLASNLLILMSWSLVTAAVGVQFGERQVISFTAQPQFVFNRQKMATFLSSSSGYCSISSSTAFSNCDGIFSTAYSMKNFEKTNCASILNPKDFNFISSQSNDNQFSVELNTISLSAAIALNQWWLDYRNAESVDFTLGPSQFTYDGKRYRLAQMIDIAAPGMDPVLCVELYPYSDDVTELVFCLIEFGSYIMYPLFNSLGGPAAAMESDQGVPDYCNCATGVGRTPECNAFQFLVGGIYFPQSTDVIATVKLFLEIFYAVLSQMDTPSDDFYYYYYQQAPMHNRSQFSTTNFVINLILYEAQYYSTTSNQTIARDYLASLCLGQNCSMLTIFAGDNNDHTVSAYFYQVANGSCADSMTTPNWASLIATPPVDLYESYYSCISGLETNIFNAIGIAQGDIGFVILFMSIAFIPLVYIVMKVTGYVPPRQEYSHEEMNAATKELTLQLLRARDGKTRGLKRTGLVVKLVEELMYSSERPPGYPDSDDELDDDNEGDEGAEGRKTKTNSAGGNNRRLTFQRPSIKRIASKKKIVSNPVIGNQQSEIAMVPISK